jgi:hypothetical protein
LRHPPEKHTGGWRLEVFCFTGLLERTKSMKTEYTCAMELASACGAYKRCVEAGNNEAMEIHHKTVLWIERQFLPSGNGIDCGCKVDILASNDEKIVIACEYHHMNDNGMYDGWTTHQILVRPAFRGLKICVRGQNRQYVHDYLYGVFDEAMQQICHKIEDGKNEFGWYFAGPNAGRWTSVPLETVYGGTKERKDKEYVRYFA